jgi:Zn-dependent alcohol dehydrogenase
MKSEAAILREPHTKWSVEEIDVDPSKTSEVLLKLGASGLCHSDEHL